MRILIMILALGALAFMLYFFWNEIRAAMSHRSTHKSSTGYKPTIKAPLDNEAPAPRHILKGQGNSQTAPVYLDCALYRVEYQFPPEKTFKVHLNATNGSSSAQVIEKSGFGTTTINVKRGAYYVLQMEADSFDDSNEDKWAMIIKKL